MMAGQTGIVIGGEIQTDALYLLEDLKRRTRLGDWALRKARQNGLVVRYIGGRAFVLGKEFIEFAATAPQSKR
jgi:hypothetical protein